MKNGFIKLIYVHLILTIILSKRILNTNKHIRRFPKEIEQMNKQFFSFNFRPFLL